MGGQVSQTLDAVLAKGQTMPEKNRFPAVLVPVSFRSEMGGNDGGVYQDGSTCTMTTAPPAVAIQDGRGLDKKQNGCGFNADGSAYTIDTLGQQAVAFANKGHFGTMSETEVSDPIRAKGGDTGDGGESIVAFSCKDHGGDASEVAPTLRSMGHDGSHENGGGQVAVAFIERGRENGRSLEVQEELTYAQMARNGGGATDRFQIMTPAMQVRRLTPEECEKLQGFLPGHTKISWKKKPAAECPDGPRYKALGNSFAVPVVGWIGARLNSYLKENRG